MTVSMYNASVPVFVRMLENLSAVLKKGEAFVAEQGLDETALTQARLAEDMFPLVKQVQIASDAAKGVGARLSGAEVPSFPDTEVTFADLQARIAKTIGFLKTVQPEQMEGSESKTVLIKLPKEELTFNGLDYLQTFAMPNFYFHVTTTYAILRHKGVQLGKKDFLAGGVVGN